MGAGSGALVAMQIAAEYPERIRRLIMLSPCGMSPNSVFDVNSWFCKSVYQTLQRNPILAHYAIQGWCASVLMLAFTLPIVKQIWLEYASPLIHRKSDHDSSTSLQLKSWIDWTLQLSAQIISKPNFADQLQSSLTNIPFYGPLDQGVLKHVSNHPKRVLVLCGAVDQVQSCESVTT